MADLLTNNEIFYTSFEPKVINRFIMYVDGIPSFVLRKCDRPKLTAEAQKIDYINLQRYYRGKTTWSPINVEGTPSWP